MKTSDFISATRKGALTMYDFPLLARIRNGSNGSLASLSLMTLAIMPRWYARRPSIRLEPSILSTSVLLRELRG